jgi:peptidoglycan/xylan/chitin deacetylase (PgdA/CDA1 family)
MEAPPAHPSTVYLTFDDGPTAIATETLLRILCRYDAHATFFLIGHHVRAHPQRVQRIVDAGHAVGNHTFTHVDAWQTAHSTVVRELEQTAQAITACTGDAVPLLRPPYGHLTPALCRWAGRRGARVVMWDVMPADFQRGASAASVARFTTAYVRSGSIVVLHDNPMTEPVTPEALEAILRWGTARGWHFAALPAPTEGA